MREDLIFDVGMHRGEDTAYDLAKGFTVIGFGGNSALVATLNQRFADETATGRVTILLGAISPNPAPTVPVVVSESHTQLGTTDLTCRDRNQSHRRDCSEISVPRVDFDDVLARHGVPFFLKIDIEGADRYCLECLQTVSTKPRHVSIECDKLDLQAIRAEVDLLSSLVYTRLRAVQRRFIAGPRRMATRATDQVDVGFERHASGPFGHDLDAPWLNRNAIEATYAPILKSCRRWGDGSRFKSSTLLKAACDLAEIAAGIALPGWFDTHATH
ncbi:MAG: FkbM family methyltransferase [Pseudomonadota bacterium]